VEVEDFEERGWKRKQTRKRLTSCGAGRGSKKYSTVSTSLVKKNRSAALPTNVATATAILSFVM